MKIGIVLTCRYYSEVLPGKILRQVCGRAVLSHLVERVRKAAPTTSIIVATTADESDEPIAVYCRRAGLECFRDPGDDVCSAFLTCADSRGWDYAVHIDGDSIFLDIDTLREMLAIAGTGSYDLVTNVPGNTFPRGMSVEIVRTAFYKSALNETSDASRREHVTTWLHDNPDIGQRYTYENRTCPDAGALNLSLDTPENLENAKRILEYAQSFPCDIGLREIYDFKSRPPIDSPWGGPAGPLMIAEIGGNHEGDFEVAKHMTELAISCGSDCVKFQLYRGDSLVSPVESPDRHRHFQKFELTRAQHIHLAEMCRAANVAYSASVWDLDMLEWIDPYLDFYKIGSGDMTAWPLLQSFARKGKPILLSTGLSTMDEVIQTTSFLQRVNSLYTDPGMLCIMQCTSMYPIPDEDANLRVMDSLRRSTRLSVGYSDHTVGTEALRAAAAMGANVIEFHFTDVREGKTFRDHQVSLVPDEVRQLKAEIGRISAFRGDGVKLPQSSELANKHDVSFRRGVYLRKAVKAGGIIMSDDLVFLRPALGTDPRDVDLLIGATALRDLEPFTALEPGVDYTST